jgi:hypothetical protein
MFAAVFGAVLVACAGDANEERLARTSAGILGGRPSGDDENANVYIETRAEQEASGILRCTGRLLAPRLVVSARHCVLKRRSQGVHCNADGSPVDIADTTDVRPEPANFVTVYFGSQKPGLRPFTVNSIVTKVEVTVCRSDIAFLVLDESPLDIRTPIRRAPVRVGESITVSGWGFASDARDALPDRRTTLDAVRVTDVGPGSIPPGTFATGGNSVCLGDSGAAVLVGGELVGTYSRIDDPGICSLELGRNIFAGIAADTDLAERAFAAIGETPWYAGERPPWLAAPGASCSQDDQCRSNRCDRTSSTCAEPCTSDGLACADGQICSGTEGGQTCVAPPPPSPPASESSCSTRPSTPRPASALVLIIALATAFVCRRRR